MCDPESKITVEKNDGTTHKEALAPPPDLETLDREDSNGDEMVDNDLFDSDDEAPTPHEMALSVSTPTSRRSVLSKYAMPREMEPLPPKTIVAKIEEGKDDDDGSISE